MKIPAGQSHSDVTRPVDLANKNQRSRKPRSTSPTNTSGVPVCQGKSLNASLDREFNGIRSGVCQGRSLNALSNREFDGFRSGVRQGKSLNTSNQEFNESYSEFQDSSTKAEEFWDEEDTSTEPSEDEEDDEMSDETMSDAAESDSRNVDETVTGVELQELMEEWAEQNKDILMNAAAGIDDLFGATGNLENLETDMHACARTHPPVKQPHLFSTIPHR